MNIYIGTVYIFICIQSDIATDGIPTTILKLCEKGARRKLRFWISRSGSEMNAHGVANHNEDEDACGKRTEMI
jgi:hypothetical protein